jgi:hypothetical protein
VVLTSLERTWSDLAAHVPPASPLAVTDQVLRRKVPREALAAALDAARGARRARLVLPLGDARSGSPMESVLRWVLHEAGVPPPALQHVVTDAAGGRVAAVDLAWPEQRVLAEFDGDAHRDRRTFVEDLRRRNGLVLAGWIVLRFSSADVLRRPAWVVATIRAAPGGR